MGIPTTMVPVRTCDSCTLDIEKWFGFLGCSAITFYRQEAQDLARKLGMIREARDRRLTCFPLWVALQAVGADGLTDRVKAAVKMVSGGKRGNHRRTISVVLHQTCYVQIVSEGL